MTGKKQSGCGCGCGGQPIVEKKGPPVAKPQPKDKKRLKASK
jgi:hypothetical protein